MAFDHNLSWVSLINFDRQRLCTLLLKTYLRVTHLSKEAILHRALLLLKLQIVTLDNMTITTYHIIRLSQLAGLDYPEFKVLDRYAKNPLHKWEDGEFIDYMKSQVQNLYFDPFEPFEIDTAIDTAIGG